MNKGDRDNDYIKYTNVENLTKFVADLVKCGRNSYNYSSLIDKLNWFVGGDIEKIRKLQRKLNSAGLSTKVIEDGVYSYQTEKAWVEFVEKCIIEMMKLHIPLNWRIVKYGFDHYNFVIGGGHYISVHGGDGQTVGYMIYIDDDYNVDVMKSTSKEFMSDFEASVGVKYEVSLDADTSNELSGNSKSKSYGATTPIKGFGTSAGYSESFDGTVTTYSGTLGYGYGSGVLPINKSVGESNNEIILHFNPFEFIKKRLDIVEVNFKNKF